MGGLLSAKSLHNGAMTGSAHGRLTRRTLVSLSFIVLAASCSGSGYQYVKDSSSTAFFKLPTAWALYDEDQILNSDTVTLSPQSQQSVAQALWMVAFDANGTPSLTHVLSAGSEQPAGFAQVRPLGSEERDTFSLSTIRNALFDVDGTSGTTGVELLSSSDVVLDGGFRGLHLEFNVPEGSDYLTVNQIGVVDPQTSTLYLFAIGCEAHCYVDNQDAIDQVAGSWTVKEPA
jgi:hypothetical protein